ncbi:hypothetical protein A2U01_0110712, partial [Trifolium medium]|nr:hypothetical protein [Trifolium medium]
PPPPPLWWWSVAFCGAPIL